MEGRNHMSKKNFRCFYPETHYYRQYVLGQYQENNTLEYEHMQGFGFHKLIFALILLILIVIKFGRTQSSHTIKLPEHCYDCPDRSTCFTDFGASQDHQLIDNNLLFIIVFFLLIICSGSFPGTCTGNGA